MVAPRFQTNSQWSYLQVPEEKRAEFMVSWTWSSCHTSFFCVTWVALSPLDSLRLSSGTSRWTSWLINECPKPWTKISEMWFILIHGVFVDLWMIYCDLPIFAWHNKHEDKQTFKLVLCRTNMRTQQIPTSKNIYLSPSFDSHLFWSCNVYVGHLHLFHLCLLVISPSRGQRWSRRMPWFLSRQLALVRGFEVSQEVFRVDSRFGGESYLYCGNILFNILN